MLTVVEDVVVLITVRHNDDGMHAYVDEFCQGRVPKISVEKLFHFILSRMCKSSVNNSEQAIEYFPWHDYSVIFRLEGLVIRNNKETVRLNSHT